MGLPNFPVSGGCSCGQVRYTLSRAPLSVYNCHCKDCQRASGAAYGISVVVAEDSFAVTGEVVSYVRTAESGNAIRMNYCANCFSWLWNDPSNPGAKVVRAGTLDDINWAKPIGNIWTDSAASWLAIDPELVNYSKGPPDRVRLMDAWMRACEG